DAALRMEALLQSSSNAMLVGTEEVRILPDPATLLENFAPTGDRYVLAARLTGSDVPSAFPDRDGEKHLAASTGEVNIIVVADTDLLVDRLWVQVQGFFGQRLVNPFANNGDFVINAADNLVGSSDLIQVRTRAIAARPFETVEALKRRADDRFRVKERELQAELLETERRLTELQSQSGETGLLSLSPAQQAELDRFEAQRLKIRGELRQVRATLDSEIQALGTRLKLINILLMPLLVSLFAAGFALWRVRQRRRAVREEG
ncbi:MAG: ABC transporter, partial [Pseudomonas sp.]|nr:ABC transporter [Pseudomonas sp.]